MFTTPDFLVDANVYSTGATADGYSYVSGQSTRALAYQQLNQPVVAYVGEIGKLTDDMKKMHSRQAGSNQSSSNQKSIQKDISNQVSKSEVAKGGKTK